MPLLLGPCLLVAVASTAGANEVAFVWWGEPDPSGIDQSFLALARRRGAAALRETPGRPTDEPLSARLARAIAQAQALDLKGAIAAFDDIERDAVARGGGTLSGGELTDLYAHRAATHLALGDEADAWNDLTQATALAPERPLDPARFAPRLIEAARRAREALTFGGKLMVSAQPSDAVLIVDGQLFGRGHVEVARAGGRHFVRAERAGFVSAGRVVAIGASGGDVHLTLTPLAPPGPEQIARRGALAEATHVVGGYIGGGAHAMVTLLYVDGHGALLGKSALPVDDQLTSGALGAAVEALLGSSAGAPAAPRERPWYRLPAVWIIGGCIVSVAISVGVVAGLGGRDNGVVTHVDLGPAR
jgi:hypothetical protein